MSTSLDSRSETHKRKSSHFDTSARYVEDP